ncbi:dermonecrotic toxin domain-containing protein [Pseudomonas sp. CCC3.1]|uniref:dermonecrotic toxin domain-containing protein n=2 Tax=unclassified Pseudomonas TaxID=196821 RepID=UPI002AC93048|nr:DUF6543 domain-containing protein [Pseudomonas sp. CCC3.1]MEB0204746.1 NEL-type E3 ubiquitin ligase domain-containing protein [Pseudomonas sp. CCC3.1]WPX38913.1 NEL-type E3 ubiquitin ligase domain-containing protein [Pseudomonas sp. CCC3.1]
MNSPAGSPATGASTSSIEEAEELANTVVVNQHELLIPELLPSWFKEAPSFVREALRESIRQGHVTQQAVAQVLAQVKSVEQFAEPLLKAALAAQGWWDINPRTHGIKEVHLLNNLLIFLSQQQFKLADTLIQLLLPDLLVPQSLEINIVSSITHQSLLQAAMQNFEADLTKADGFAPGTQIYQVEGSSARVSAAFKPEAFAAICRNLDLGQQYQTHLSQIFDPPDDPWPTDDPRSTRYKLNTLFSLNMQHAFSSALHLTYMKGHISPTHYMFMVDLLSLSKASAAQAPPRHSTLKIMGFEVPGIVLMWPDQKTVGQTQRCLLYLPQAPDQSFHLFQTFNAFKEQLREWLKEPEFSRYFATLLPLRHRAEFMRRIDTKNVTLDSLLIRRPPIINEPALFLETQHIPQSQPLFEVAWRLTLEQIKDDARVLIVPTGDEDTKSRVTRLASYLNWGVSLFGIALGFVPILGDVLLAVSVVQLGSEVYEGIKAWRRGDRVQALEYMFDIAQNLTLIAGTAGAAKALRPSPVVDELMPVTTVQGQKRLWVPDLRPYEINASLASLKPDAQGVYTFRERSFIKLEGKIFSIKTDPVSGQGYIQHPTDPLAYTPKLQHNSHGAWTHELEKPQLWRREQLFRRLGPDAEFLSGNAMDAVLQVSNTTDDGLRALFMDNLPRPPALADSIKRANLCERVERFTLQMKQGMNNVADNADLQLALLTELPGWPANQVLRVLDVKGGVVKEYGRDLAPIHPRMQITEVQIENGDLLKTTLECLSSGQRAVLLGEDLVAADQQIQRLARKLGDHAESVKQSLVTRLYNASEPVPPELNTLNSQFSGLPVTVMTELMSHLTPNELLAFKTTDRLPLHVLEEARSFVQTVRLNRALEGLYFEGLSNADTQTLAWETVSRLPGWPENLSLVLRDKTTGQDLQRLGNASATNRMEIFKNADNYEFFSTVSEDLYSSPQLLKCVVKALTPSARTAMGLPEANAEQALALKVASLAAHERTNSAQKLGLQTIKPWLKSPMRLADGRIGYTLGGRSGHLRDENKSLLLKNLVLELYPLMTEVQAGQFLYHLRLSPALATRALVALKAQLQTLRSDLAQWEANPVWSQPRTGPQVLLSAAEKRAISQRLILAWRRQTPSINIGDHTGYVLDLNSWSVDNLPVLSADFSHISALRLTDSPSGQLPFHFLQRFPNLRVLSLENNHLPELPASLASLSNLTDLNLQGNQVVLTSGAVELLSGLRKLKSLNLTGNPLARRISVRQLPDLEYLRLRHTQISEWPEGVETLTHLHTLDLRDNAIIHIPSEILTAERAAINRVTNLHDNPLNADSIRRLDIYRREQGINLGVEVQHMHARSARGILHWAREPTLVQTRVWNDLSSLRQSRSFFRVLEDMSESEQFFRTQDDLTERVWAMLTAIHENSELRRLTFDIAANPRTCRDGSAMTFASLELQGHVSTALRKPVTEEELLKLSRGLYRLELLDKHVTEVVSTRHAAIIAEQQAHIGQLQTLIDAVSPDYAPSPLVEMSPEEQQGVAYRLGTPEALRLAPLLSPEALRRQLARHDPLEVQMYYHIELANRLDLPARPTSMRFAQIAQVTPGEVEVAREFVINQETASALSASIETRDFWIAFLEKKYSEAFRVSDEPYQMRLDVLFSGRESESSGNYLASLEAIKEERNLARKALVARLTAQELQEHPLSGPLASPESHV